MSICSLLQDWQDWIAKWHCLVGYSCGSWSVGTVDVKGLLLKQVVNAGPLAPVAPPSPASICVSAPRVLTSMYVEHTLSLLLSNSNLHA